MLVNKLANDFHVLVERDIAQLTEIIPGVKRDITRSKMKIPKVERDIAQSTCDIAQLAEKITTVERSIAQLSEKIRRASRRRLKDKADLISLKADLKNLVANRRSTDMRLQSANGTLGSYKSLIEKLEAYNSLREWLRLATTDDVEKSQIEPIRWTLPEALRGTCHDVFGLWTCGGGKSW